MPQLESKKIVLTEILSEWPFLEYKLAKWSRNDFPLESWESTGMKFDGLSNLFGLIHYFLTLIVSSAEAEHVFSILKSLKPSSCSNQPTFTTANACKYWWTRYQKFWTSKVLKSIDYWYKQSSSKHRDGKACAKRPAHGNKPHKKPGSDPEQTKLNFVAI